MGPHCLQRCVSCTLRVNNLVCINEIKQGLFSHASYLLISTTVITIGQDQWLSCVDLCKMTCAWSLPEIFIWPWKTQLTYCWSSEAEPTVKLRDITLSISDIKDVLYCYRHHIVCRFLQIIWRLYRSSLSYTLPRSTAHHLKKAS